MPSCDICGQSVKTTQGLRGHRAFKHGLHQGTPQPKSDAPEQLRGAFGPITGTIFSRKEMPWVEATPVSIGEWAEEVDSKLTRQSQTLKTVETRLNTLPSQQDILTLVQSALNEIKQQMPPLHHLCSQHKCHICEAARQNIAAINRN